MDAVTLPRIDPTLRWRCATHGDAAATYLGRERYGCWHCEVERLRAAAAAVEPMPGEQCVNKACGEDATTVIKGDPLCAVHAEMAREKEARIDA